MKNALLRILVPLLLFIAFFAGGGGISTSPAGKNLLPLDNTWLGTNIFSGSSVTVNNELDVNAQENVTNGGIVSDAGSFLLWDGKADFSTTKGMGVTNGSPFTPYRGVFDLDVVTSLASPTSGAMTQFDSLSGNMFAGGNCFEWHVYAYTAGHALYSAPLDLNSCDNADGHAFYNIITYSAVTGAAGYLLEIVQDDWFGNNGETFDVGNVLTSNYGDGTESSYDTTLEPPFTTAGGPDLYVDSTTGDLITQNHLKSASYVDAPFFKSTAPTHDGNVATGSMVFDMGTPTAGSYNYFRLLFNGQFSFLSFGKDTNSSDGQRFLQFTNYANSLELFSLDADVNNSPSINMRSASYFSISHGSADSNIDLKITSGSVVTTKNNTLDNGSGAATLKGKVTTYNNIVTAGNGLQDVVAFGRLTAKTSAQASVATFTPAADGSFIVSANVLVTTSTLHNFTVTCAYTDEGGTARTSTFNFQNVAGTIATAIANAGGAVPYEAFQMHIRAKAATAITIATTGTFTTVTYNVEGTIEQVG